MPSRLSVAFRLDRQVRSLMRGGYLLAAMLLCVLGCQSCSEGRPLPDRISTDVPAVDTLGAVEWDHSVDSDNGSEAGRTCTDTGLKCTSDAECCGFVADLGPLGAHCVGGICMMVDPL